MSFAERADLSLTPLSGAVFPATAKPAGADLTPSDRAFLLQLQRQAIEYFLDNQAANGLMLDRQSNHGPRRPHGLCSTAATGMGLVALALASAPPHNLLGPSAAATRVRAGLEGVLERLPHDMGVVPHFVDSATGAVVGVDPFSTIETAWVVAGALWAAAFLQDAELTRLAGRIYDRVDWQAYTVPDARGSNRLIRHGKGQDGDFLACAWDRLNGETVFMYVLAAGAEPGRAISAGSWAALRPFYGLAGGLRFNNADLGLFVFQYGLDLLDLGRWQAPGSVDLAAEARVAAVANHEVCRQAATRFATYRRYWGLSAGDGPATAPEPDAYRCYSPAGPIDGTAHLTATLASVAHHPSAVLQHLHEARHDAALPARGRYGFSNLNVDRHWVGRDMVGIDAGAAVLALDNYLQDNRVRNVFHGLPGVSQGLARLGFIPLAPHAEPTAAAVRLAS